MKKREAVWKKYDRPQGSFKEFLRRHDRALTFFGAMVVFCTFVIREGVREYLKEASDSLRSSEAKFENYQLTNMTIGISSWPGEMIEKSEDLDKERYEDTEQTDEDEWKAELARADDILDVRPFGRGRMEWLKNNAFPTPSIFDLLPMTKERSAESEKIDKNRDGMIAAFDSIPRMTKAELNAKSRKQQEAEVDKIIRSYNRFINAATPYIRSLLSAYSEILEVAHKKRDRAERWYIRCTWASYFLYTLGWGLGLVGKLYGTGGGGE